MFLMRLDDAAPNWQKAGWIFMRDLLAKYHVKPLVAVIPRNCDQALLQYPEDESFWKFITDCRDRYGWTLALHGDDHVLSSPCGGMNPVNHISEFAGIPLDEQRRKISSGIAALHKNGIFPQCFVPPAHTFDRNTLEALRSESDIRIISDTIANDIYFEDGFYFIPQQTGMARALPFRISTFCYHPNTTTQAQFSALELFLQKYAFKQRFTSFDELVFSQKRRSVFDAILAKAYFHIRCSARKA